MLTATGNNFGDSIIQLKDYQSDKMVILNGRFQLPTETEEYQAAEQLEIYVPDLSIPKSTMTAVFQHGFSSDKSYITALKSWIKNKNTIVIEKPFILRRAENEPELDFFCAYVPKGVRFDIDALQPTTLTIENSTLPNLASRTSNVLLRRAGCSWPSRSRGPRRRMKVMLSRSDSTAFPVASRQTFRSSSNRVPTELTGALKLLSRLLVISSNALDLPECIIGKATGWRRGYSL